MQTLDGPDRFAADEPALASCYAAAAQGIALSGDRAGQPFLRLVLPAEPPPSADLDPSDPVAEVRGVNVHARQWVHGNDRRAVERLARYITRPPQAAKRPEAHQPETHPREARERSEWRPGGTEGRCAQAAKRPKTHEARIASKSAPMARCF